MAAYHETGEPPNKYRRLSDWDYNCLEHHSVRDAYVDIFDETFRDTFSEPVRPNSPQAPYHTWSGLKYYKSARSSVMAPLKRDIAEHAMVRDMDTRVTGMAAAMDATINGPCGTKDPRYPKALTTLLDARQHVRVRGLLALAATLPRNKTCLWNYSTVGDNLPLATCLFAVRASKFPLDQPPRMECTQEDMGIFPLPKRPSKMYPSVSRHVRGELAEFNMRAWDLFKELCPDRRVKVMKMLSCEKVTDFVSQAALLISDVDLREDVYQYLAFDLPAVASDIVKNWHYRKQLHDFVRGKIQAEWGDDREAMDESSDEEDSAEESSEEESSDDESSNAESSDDESTDSDYSD